MKKKAFGYIQYSAHQYTKFHHLTMCMPYTDIPPHFQTFNVYILLQSLTSVDFDFLFLYFWEFFSSARLNQGPHLCGSVKTIPRVRAANRTLDLPRRNFAALHI